MRKWTCFLLLSLYVLTALGQTEKDPPFKRFPTVPAFSLLKIDSTTITKENLVSNKPTMFMYFNPGCEHCQHQMEDMITHKEALKDIQIVMATYAPLPELADFITKYKVAEFPNIQAGRDTKYMMQPFFKIGGLPYQALYDAEGKLITTYEGNVKIDTLLSSFKKKD
ncbi:TlpA family protein disulfide reductase [Flavitalea antarctica]